MAGLDVKKMRGKASDALAGFTTGQKAMMVAATVLVVVGMMVFTRAQGGVSMAPLYSNLDATDASAITAKLDGQGTKYQLSNGGQTIMVPSKDVYALRLKMSADGLPSGGAASFALLDKQGITTSQFKQRIDYQRALGGELGRTVAAMDGIAAAVVNLSIPTDDVFAADNKKATASVLLRTNGSAPLSDGQIKSIVDLVAQAVPDLSPDAISVTDQKGSQLWYPGKSADVSTGSSNVLERTKAFQNQMAADIEQLIATSVGPGKVKVAVNAALDFDQQEQTQTIYNNPNTNGGQLILARDAATEQYNANGVVGGVVGVDGNPSIVNGTPTGTVTATTQPGATTTVAGGAGAAATTVPASTSNAGAYVNTKDNSQFAVNRIDTAVKTAPGKVQKLGVSIVVDDKTVDDAAATKIKNLVTPYIDAKRGDVLSIERMTFDTTAADTAAKALAAAGGTAAAGGGLMGMLKMVFTALIILVALFLAWRSIRTAAKGDVTTTIDLRELEAVREELRTITLTGTSGGSGLALGTGTSGLGELPSGQPVRDPFQLEPIPLSRAAVMASQMEAEITDLIEQQPDEVALLLRNWLSERRIVRKA